MIIKKGICIVLTIFFHQYGCAQNTAHGSWRFSPEFLACYQQQKTENISTINSAHHEAYITTNATQEKALTTPSILFSYENAQHLINIAAIIFAAIKIYQRYETINITPSANNDNTSWSLSLKNIMPSILPSILYNISIYGSFLTDSTKIVFQALVYKTIAKLLLLCAHGDITDVLKSVFDGGRYAVKKVLGL